jgi:DNA repair exonuclease SbcCD nuclease subunit
MPTFLHAADLHIDSPLRGLERRFEGAKATAFASKVREATRQALANLVDLAIARKVSFVVLAGDVVDGDATLQTALFLSRQFGRLRAAGIPVFAALGNHDCSGLIPTHLAPMDGVHVFARDRAETIECEGVALHGRSYPVWDLRTDIAADYPQAVRGCLNVGVLHTALTGSDEHDSYAPTSPQVLAAKGYAYWALGHIHKRQDNLVVDGSRIVFPGNLQGRSIRETGPKGCVLVSHEDARITDVEFVACDVVRWHIVEVAAAQTAEATQDLVHSAVLSATSRDREAGYACAVRVRVAGAHAEAARWRGSRGEWRENLLFRLQESPDLAIEQLELAVLEGPGDDAEQLQGARALLQQAVAELARQPEELRALFEPLHRQLKDTGLHEAERRKQFGGAVPFPGQPMAVDALLRQGLDTISALMAR